MTKFKLKRSKVKDDSHQDTEIEIQQESRQKAASVFDDSSGDEIDSNTDAETGDISMTQDLPSPDKKKVKRKINSRLAEKIRERLKNRDRAEEDLNSNMISSNEEEEDPEVDQPVERVGFITKNVANLFAEHLYTSPFEDTIYYRILETLDAFPASEDEFNYVLSKLTFQSHVWEDFFRSCLMLKLPQDPFWQSDIIRNFIKIGMSDRDGFYEISATIPSPNSVLFSLDKRVLIDNGDKIADFQEKRDYHGDAWRLLEFWSKLLRPDDRSRVKMIQHHY